MRRLLDASLGRLQSIVFFQYAIAIKSFITSVITNIPGGSVDCIV